MQPVEQFLAVSPFPLSVCCTAHEGDYSSVIQPLLAHRPVSPAAWGTLLAIHPLGSLSNVFMDTPCFFLDCSHSLREFLYFMLNTSVWQLELEDFQVVNTVSAQVVVPKLLAVCYANLSICPYELCSCINSSGYSGYKC